MKITKNLSPIIFLILTLQLSAWGSKGHDIIAEIADRNLTPTAKAEVTRLLNGKTMVYYAVWMDNIRSDSTYDFTSTWHYANVDSGQTYETMPRVETGDVVTATDLSIQKITSRTETDSVKGMYLKFLIHLVADLHCPMHAGRATDRGGNLHRVTWFGSQTNLHSLWDGAFLERARSWSYTEWADNLVAPLKPADINQMQRGTPKEWFGETVVVADHIYRHTPLNADLRWSYIYEHLHRNNILEPQLIRAGYRLAYVLNTIFI